MTIQIPINILLKDNTPPEDAKEIAKQIEADISFELEENASVEEYSVGEPIITAQPT